MNESDLMHVLWHLTMGDQLPVGLEQKNKEKPEEEQKEADASTTGAKVDVDGDDPVEIVEDAEGEEATSASHTYIYIYMGYHGMTSAMGDRSGYRRHDIRNTQQHTHSH